MKRNWIIRICLLLCLVLGLGVLAAGKVDVQAAEITVTGTVVGGTTSELLLLSTEGGTMHIKLDPTTDTSSCKILLPGKSIYVTIERGSDAYFHAKKITNDPTKPSVTLDSATTSTVTGTLSDKSREDLLYVNTDQGEMQIKMDTTTNISGCSVLVAGRTYTITCVRGSDAYMHATTIADAAKQSTSSSSSKLSTAVTLDSNTPIAVVAGTVSSDTKENLLYLSTSGGDMQFVIDSITDASKGMVLTPGSQLAVSYYRGSDAYLHAACIVGAKNMIAASGVDSSAVSTVSGTVGSKSNENVLYLTTQQGTMEIKLDSLKNLNNCKVLVSGKKVSVSCARGSDAYLHALEITAE